MEYLYYKTVKNATGGLQKGGDIDSPMVIKVYASVTSRIFINTKALHNEDFFKVIFAILVTQLRIEESKRSRKTFDNGIQCW